MDKFLSKYQCGFRKGYNAQHCRLAKIEKWKKAVDNGKIFGALLENLSKAFDCLPHDLIIAKLYSYGFNLTALNLIHNYLTKRKQKTKINYSYISWEDILFGVPQGSILGPILFNIFLSDLFLIVDDIDIANYKDDNTIYKEHKNIDDLITSLQDAAAKLFKWFSDNQMKGNTDKCYLLLGKDESSEIHIGDSIIESSTYEKLLDIKIDSKLRFDDHIQDLCNKANRKLRALARRTPYMNLQKRKVLMNAFFNAQFNYCPLIWMLYSRQNNNKVKHLHERYLRLINNDKLSSYEEVLEKDGLVSIHHKNIQGLAIEMFQIKHGQSPDIVSNIFTQTTQHYNFRQNQDFRISSVKSVYHSSESISYLGPKIWEIVPAKIKETNFLNSFKIEPVSGYHKVVHADFASNILVVLIFLQ